MGAGPTGHDGRNLLLYRWLQIKYILLNVDALGAEQTSGPNDTKHVLVTRGPIFISCKYGSRGRYIEQIKTGQNMDQKD